LPLRPEGATATPALRSSSGHRCVGTVVADVHRLEPRFPCGRDILLEGVAHVEVRLRREPLLGRLEDLRVRLPDTHFVRDDDGVRKVVEAVFLEFPALHVPVTVRENAELMPLR